MVDFTTPTRAQLAQMAGNDQRLIIALEALFDVGADNAAVQTEIDELQEDVTNIQGDIVNIEGNVAANSGNITTIEGDIVTINTRIDSLENSAAIGQAEAVVLSTYGDTVSVADKGKNLNKFGTNATVGNSFETVAQFQGSVANETYASTNSVLAIVSSNAADTQTIVIEGHTVDGSGNLTFTTQEATLTGQTPVVLATPLARANRAYVRASGTFNTYPADLSGTVSVYDSTDGETGGVPDTDSAVKLVIEAGFTQSEKCATSVSQSDYWFITSFAAGIGDAGGSASRVTFRIEARDVANGGAWLPKGRDIVVNVDQNAGIEYLDPLIIIPKNHDVRVRAKTDSNTAEVFAEIRGVLAVIA